MDLPGGTKVFGRLWVDRNGHGFLGRGRIELLEKIREFGSISQAAKSMKMSYKAAWDAVDAMNNLSEKPLVIRKTGGKEGGGTEVTEYGKQVVEWFHAVEGQYQRFLDEMDKSFEGAEKFRRLAGGLALKTSARNQFLGKVMSVKSGPVYTKTVLDINGGDRVTAIITKQSAETLDLKKGAEVYALIKASSVIVVDGGSKMKLGAKNILCGTVIDVREGAVNGEVSLQLKGGKTITAVITNESIRDLDLREGQKAAAIVKETSVILAVNEYFPGGR